MPQEKKLHGLSCHTAGVVYSQIAQDVFQVEGIAGAGGLPNAVLFGEFFCIEENLMIHERL
jgi:hypothetical protein